MKKYFYTYLLIHPIDGKMYIGSRGCSELPIDDTNYKSSSKQVSAEYLQCCEKFILKTFLTYYDALLHEIFLHELYDVACNDDFFNAAKQTTTSFNRSGVPMSDAHKQRISKAHRTPKNQKRASEALRARRLGMPLSDTTKEKLRLCNLGGKSAKAKQVTCIENGMIFSAVSEAAKWANIHYSGIVKTCNGTQKSAAGFTWKYK